MANIYELLSRRQSELEDKEKELLILVKELESVQQELDDIRQMTNIRLLEPAQEVQETEAPLSPEPSKKLTYLTYYFKKNSGKLSMVLVVNKC